MKVFYLSLIIVFFNTYMARELASKKSICKDKIKPNKILVSVSISILTLVSGLRGLNIGDTVAYFNSFLITEPNVVGFFKNIKLEGEWGFDIFQIIIKQFVTDDPRIYLIICAFITNLFIGIVIYKYCHPIELGFFIYICAGNYLVTMNGVRQYLASALLFLCIKFIIDGKWYVFFPMVLIAYTFHNTAIIFLVLYFFIRTKAWSNFTLLFIGASVFIYMFYGTFATFFTSLLQGTHYSVYEKELLLGTGGANYMRFAVSVVPLVFSCMLRNKLRSKGKIFDVVTNFSMLNAMAMLFATRYWIFARFSIYFSLFNLILLCWCVMYVVDKKRRAVLYVPLVTCYFIYYYYEMVISLNMVYASCFINF